MKDENTIGLYLENSNLKYYDVIINYTYSNPVPGFHMNK